MKRTIRNMRNIIGVVALLMVMLVTEIGAFSVVKAQSDSYKTENGIVNFPNGDANIIVRGNDGQSLVGKKFAIHQLFEAENASGLESIDYTLNPVYATALKTVVASKMEKTVDEMTEYEIVDYLQSLNSQVVEGAQTAQNLEGRYSDYRYFIEELAAQFKKDNISGIVLEVSDVKADNTIELTGLSYGYYMVEDISESSGAHTAISMPMLTTTNPESSITIKADYPTVIKKIQEDDNQEAIGNNGWNDIGDFEIGQDVPFKYESVIPNVNGYHTYYYAWHDKMDEALTLQPDTIRISITGTYHSNEKTYQLTQEEFNLITDISEATFKIEVADMKAIIDREFPNKNEKQENSYGQQVLVAYNATLSEKAALDSGLPGFENDVRLEFSNNPNQTTSTETGFTPWDTVVCFTYQLSGRKINNYGKRLEGAAFGLYTDEECENEVYVKKVANRYVVMNQDSLEEASSSEPAEIISDSNGEFEICGLDSGTYYLKEENAPAGYRALLEPIVLQVSPNFLTERNNYIKGEGANGQVVTLTANARTKVFSNGTYTEKETTLEVNQEKGSMNLSIVNEVGKKLPIAGAYAMPILFVIGIALMGIALRRGHKKYE